MVWCEDSHARDGATFFGALSIFLLKLLNRDTTFIARDGETSSSLSRAPGAPRKQSGRAWCWNHHTRPNPQHWRHQCHELPNTVAHRVPCRESPSFPLAPRPGIMARVPAMPRISALVPCRARRPGAKLPTAASKSSSASVTSSASSCWSSTICSDPSPTSAQPRQNGARRGQAAFGETPARGAAARAVPHCWPRGALPGRRRGGASAPPAQGRQVYYDK